MYRTHNVNNASFSEWIIQNKLKKNYYIDTEWRIANEELLNLYQHDVKKISESESGSIVCECWCKVASLHCLISDSCYNKTVKFHAAIDILVRQKQESVTGMNHDEFRNVQHCSLVIIMGSKQFWNTSRLYEFNFYYLQKNPAHQLQHFLARCNGHSNPTKLVQMSQGSFLVILSSQWKQKNMIDQESLDLRRWRDSIYQKNRIGDEESETLIKAMTHFWRCQAKKTSNKICSAS